jgi:KUP system potassium uptake protein
MVEPAADKPASNPLEADSASKTPTAEPEAGSSEAAPPSPNAPALQPEAEHHSPSHRDPHPHLAALTLGALGVVYGDIGTSPLYALRECFHPTHGVAVTAHNVYGVLSLVFWSLTLIVSIKYLLYVLRADNEGEGGTLALMALASSAMKSPRTRMVIALLGVLGAALIYGDGMITPAISVLSAVEGLEIAAPELHSFVVPITIVILIGLFSIQRHGTARVGAFFGPVMIVWFSTLAILGVSNILRHPEVLGAVWPGHAVRFFQENRLAGVIVLGSVVLVITGGEALYADLGHFGKKPIRLAWFGLAMPALILNYFGQGSLIIDAPKSVANPFFLLAPTWALLPLIALSTAATVIASQAMISGVYSLTRAGAMLGFLPRMNVLHTSAHERGQIYVPFINWCLMLAAIALVLGFRSSSNLAGAYGIAVTMTMALTTVLAFFLTHYAWGFSLPKSLALTALFLVPELFFVGANLTKVPHGGWFPLVLGASLFSIMTTWKRGRAILFQRFQDKLLPLSDFYELMHVELPARVPGTAVFMTSADGTPPAMLHNFLHNRVVHQHIVLLTIVTSDAARVPEEERCTIQELENGFVRVVARYGFMERPDVPKLLLREKLVSSVEHTTFFLGRETMIATERPGMARWRVHLFSFLARNALPATRFFNIPPDRVMEIGAQIEL